METKGEHWPQNGRKRVEQAIDRFWSAALLPFEPTVISPPQESNVMHDGRGPFTNWPAPPEAAEFEQARAVYLAELACNDQYIGKSMWWQAKYDLALEQAFRAKAKSGDCPDLAQVLAEGQ